MNDAKLIFVENFTRIWDQAKLDGLSQGRFAKRLGVSQKTVSNVLSAVENGRQIRLDTIEAIARGMSTDAWVLFIPNIPLELLKGHELEQVLGCYTTATNEGRKRILSISKEESIYELTQEMTAEDRRTAIIQQAINSVRARFSDITDETAKEIAETASRIGGSDEDAASKARAMLQSLTSVQLPPEPSTSNEASSNKSA